jgi:hypothetical protein
LDRVWLGRLKAQGLAAFVPAPPSPPEAFWQGVQEFNAGDFWQAHETLERVWMATPYPTRLFHYAVIKLAVGLLHLERHNGVGGRRQLAAAAQLLEPFTPGFLGLRTDLLLEAAWARLRLLGVEPSPVPQDAGEGAQQRRAGEGGQRGPPWKELDRLPRPCIQS